jgi:hypothetical protein
MFRYQGPQQLPRDDIDEAAAHWIVPEHDRVFSVPQFLRVTIRNSHLWKRT